VKKRPKLLAGIGAIAVLFSLVPLWAGAAEQSAGLEYVGLLPQTKGDEGKGFVVGIDDKRRDLYYMYRHGVNFHLRQYDLRSEIPRLVRDRVVGEYGRLGINSFSPYTIQIDPERQQMLVLAGSAYGTVVRFIDLKSLRFVGQWDVGAQLPGFVAQGMTISKADDRIYLIGAQAGNAYGTDSRAVAKPAHASMVVALEADPSPDQAPQLAWARLVPECTQVMNTFSVGAMIARSRNFPALYFACARANPYPGESAIVRLGIDPKADHAGAVSFPVEFFPVSGSYTSTTEGIVGMAAFDYKRDRIFIQSLSYATPGVWVFDGRVSAWVGFIASPDSSNRYFGFDPSSGHYYVGGAQGAHKTGFILVSDVSATPITQGEEFRGIPTRGFISVDPRTQRLFVQADLKVMGVATGEAPDIPGILVLRDNTSIREPDRALDYDELTRDVDEGQGVVTSFSGSASGFGTRVLLVGGYGGLVSFTGQRPTVGSLRPGDRGFTAARIPSIDLRQGGSAASAQALVPDNNTVGDLKDLGGGEWPWTPATCLDGGGSKIAQDGEGPNGRAHVECDLSKDHAAAVASYGALQVEGLSVADSSMVTSARRDQRLGVVTETEARATGVEIRSPAGSVSIAKVFASVQTQAHGRPGTAKAQWTRRLVGIELADATGEVIQRVGECGSDEDTSCRDIVTQINRLLQTRLRIELPKAEIIQTPRGAFATVRQDEAGFLNGRTMDNQGSTFSNEGASRVVPGLQVTFFNDSDEKSRMIAQLAGIQANSIYTNTPYEEQQVPTVDLPVDTVSADAGGSAGSIGSEFGPGLGDTSSIPMAGAPIDAPIEALVASNPVEGALAFLRRSPGEAVLFAGIWSMFIAALGALVRRRALLSVLTGGS
jgi:hypothetical protein